MNDAVLRLKVMLPSEIFADRRSVTRIVAQTHEGSFGILPNRLDCVAALKPGILAFDESSGRRTFLALDEGVLVKVGHEVRISVRNAVGGADLGRLREAVDRQFLARDEREKGVRVALALLESSFVRRLLELRHA